MAKRLSTIILILVSFCAVSSAQVIVNVNPAIETNLRMKNARIDTTGKNGYRIQIAFTKEKSIALRKEGSFLSRYPAMRGQTYRMYQQPNWKVRVGNYRREIDAQAALTEYRKYFRESFMVKSHITIR